jgi:hypothetical protein
LTQGKFSSITGGDVFDAENCIFCANFIDHQAKQLWWRIFSDDPHMPGHRWFANWQNHWRLRNVASSFCGDVLGHRALNHCCTLIPHSLDA